MGKQEPVCIGHPVPTTQRQPRLTTGQPSLSVVEPDQTNTGNGTTRLVSKRRSLHMTREESIEALLAVCRRILCYLPRAYDGPGPKGELEAAIKQLEGEI